MPNDFSLIVSKKQEKIDKEANRVPNTPYYVVMWDDKSKFTEHNTLNEAKRRARAHGYTYTRLGGNLPLAFVAIDQYNNDQSITRTCIYNPMFR